MTLEQTRDKSVHLSRGQMAEELAVEIVARQQYSILMRNFHSRFGEIDIICQYQSSLVFIEVRHRSSSRWGGALQSVSEKKQNKIIKTAGQFLLKHPKYAYFNCRFDVISFQDTIDAEHAQWIKSAFIL